MMVRLHKLPNRYLCGFFYEIKWSEIMKNKIIIGIALVILMVFPMQVFANNDIEKDRVGEEVTTVSGNSNNNAENKITVSGNNTVQLPEVPVEEYSYDVDYAIYSNTMKAQLCDKQLEYLTVLHSEMKQKYEIEKAKQDMGYTTLTALTEAETQLQIVTLQIESVRAEKAFYIDNVGLYGVEYQKIDVSDKLPDIEEDYVSMFIANNKQMAYYEQQIETYENYINTMYLTETQLKNIYAQLELLEQNRNLCQIEVEINTRQKILNYENAVREVKQLDYQIVSLQNSIDIQKLLYEQGKIAKIELVELETQLKQLEFQRLNVLYNAHLLLYELQNGIN